MNSFDIIKIRFKKTTIQIICLGFLLLAFGACNTNSKAKNQDIITQPLSIIAPVIIKTGALETHSLNEAPRPEISFLSKNQSINTTADFYVSMQNFNTAQGLALSSILCGFMDSKGNLWFGTSGNGASKYDGKSFTNYTSSNGLIHNLIISITEDRKGNIWFSTYGGASKFDGTSFINFTTEDGLMDNEVDEIFQDSKGNIWFATVNGINKYDPLNKDKPNKTFIGYNLPEELSDAPFYSISEDEQGYLWFGYNGGVIRYDPALDEKGSAAFKDFSEALGVKGEMVNSIMQDSQGTIWIGTESLICKYDPNKDISSKNAVLHYTIADGLKSDYIFCATEDRDGNIWFGTREGVSKYIKASNSFLNFTTKQGLANNTIKSITEDRSGSLWFGTLGGGLSRFSGGAVTEFTTAQGLPSELIFAITEDEEGNLWFAPEEGGIVKYQDNIGISEHSVFLNHSIKQGVPFESTYAAVKDKKDNLWFGHPRGLSKFDGVNFTTYTTEQGLPDDYITSLSSDSEGNIWIGTYAGGVSKFNGKAFTNFNTTQGLVHKTVWDIFEDKEKVIWIATRGGLSRYDGSSFMNFTKDQGLPDNKLSSVIQDKNGNIIIGSWGGGISVIKKQRAEKLASEDTNQSSEVIFENFSTADGIANDVIYRILEDSSGNIILGSNVGLTILNGGISPNQDKLAKNSIENYNEKTGYPIKDVSNTASLFLDSKGIIWAGTGDKVVRFDYTKVRKSTEAPRLLIKNIKIDNEPVSWQTLQWERTKEKTKKLNSSNTPAYINEELTVFDKKLTDIERKKMVDKFSNINFDTLKSTSDNPENLVLPFVKNDISFDFVGIETTRPSLVRYQYLLEGYDDHWSPVTNATTATFGNIFEGDYTFLLKARSPDGVWSEPLSYSFKILPPWYRSWIAKFFYLLLFLGSLFFIDRYQRGRVLVKERQKTIQRELEHAKEIKKAYTDLQSTQALLVQSEKMASLGELTAGIAHEIQNPLNFVNNFSEVSNELLEEMAEELTKGDYDEAKAIANDVKENLEKIVHHGKRAQGIVQGMLMHSRSSTGKKELTDINKLTDEYFRLAYHGLRAKDKSFNATLITDYDDTINAVKIVPQDIGRVILNLITNAFFVVDEKRKEKLNGYQPTVSVATKKKGNKVIISVKDNGNGIPKEVINKIFQPFFTTKPSGQGTGLGLSLSYDIVHAHGGELSVDTEESIGTTFTITLPKGKN